MTNRMITFAGNYIERKSGAKHSTVSASCITFVDAIVLVSSHDPGSLGLSSSGYPARRIL